MKTLKYLALAVALGLASGCEDDEPAKIADAAAGLPDGGAGTGDGGAVTADGGAGTPDGGGGTADGGAGGDGGGGGGDGGVMTTIGLVDFVTRLVGNSSATSLPETLDDKTVTDTTDPAAFDRLLAR